MKKYLLLTLFIPLFLSGCRTTQLATVVDIVNDEATSEPVAVIDVPENKIIDFRDASTWILGDFSPEKLRFTDHSSWYVIGYDEYTPDQAIMEELNSISKEGLTITVVLGTWCPDSRREVPRFMKIMSLWGFPEDSIRFIGVDINKVAPLDDYLKLEIVRVPTFIFYENFVEAGRIIEVPLTSLEQDMRDILSR